MKHQFMNSCMMTIAEATNSNSNKPINLLGCLEVPELHHTGLVNILCIVAYIGIHVPETGKIQWSPI